MSVYSLGHSVVNVSRLLYDRQAMDDHEDSEKRERVLLRPWLENLIESGSIPGLEWMDDVKTTFKVPWKHRSKKTWSLRHSSIFLVSAVLSIG